MFADGSNGSVELKDDQIIIRRKGFANVLTQGIQGDKAIPLSSITAVQFRAAGKWMAGLIQFTLLGGREFSGGMMEATKDENAVMFTDDQQPAFEALRGAVQGRIGRAAHQATPMASGVGDLVQLADLLERGHISKDEFDTAKSKILTAGQSSGNVQGTRDSVDSTYKELSVPRDYQARKKDGFDMGRGCLFIVAIIAGLMLLKAIFPS
jgi:hypothetical protein